MDGVLTAIAALSAFVVYSTVVSHVTYAAAVNIHEL